jgi:serine/threonine-protein kinase
LTPKYLTPLRAVAADYRNIRFSPDGRRLAISIRQGVQEDVWVYEWMRDTLSRLTFDVGVDNYPVWTPNGQRIAFASTRADKAIQNLYWQQADGTGVAERLTESPNPQFPTSWHPSGKLLAFTELHPQTGNDIMIVPLEGDEVSGWKPGTPSVFLNTQFSQIAAAFSPDGGWLAYTSNESGTYDVYVRPFPGPGGKWLVSTGGGSSPVWSRNGRELFYWSRGQIWVASYAVLGDSFRAEKPRAWSPGRVPGGAFTGFDLHPDGKRFAVVKAAEETEARVDKVVFITNFFDELRRIGPPAKR